MLWWGIKALFVVGVVYYVVSRLFGFIISLILTRVLHLPVSVQSVGFLLLQHLRTTRTVGNFDVSLQAAEISLRFSLRRWILSRYSNQKALRIQASGVKIGIKMFEAHNPVSSNASPAPSSVNEALQNRGKEFFVALLQSIGVFALKETELSLVDVKFDVYSIQISFYKFVSQVDGKIGGIDPHSINVSSNVVGLGVKCLDNERLCMDWSPISSQIEWSVHPATFLRPKRWHVQCESWNVSSPGLLPTVGVYKSLVPETKSDGKESALLVLWPEDLHVLVKRINIVGDGIRLVLGETEFGSERRVSSPTAEEGGIKWESSSKWKVQCSNIDLIHREEDPFGQWRMIGVKSRGAVRMTHWREAPRLEAVQLDAGIGVLWEEERSGEKSDRSRYRVEEIEASSGLDGVEIHVDEEWVVLGKEVVGNVSEAMKLFDGSEWKREESSTPLNTTFLVSSARICMHPEMGELSFQGLETTAIRTTADTQELFLVTSTLDKFYIAVKPEKKSEKLKALMMSLSMSEESESVLCISDIDITSNSAMDRRGSMSEHVRVSSMDCPLGEELPFGVQVKVNSSQAYGGLSTAHFSRFVVLWRDIICPLSDLIDDTKHLFMKNGMRQKESKLSVVGTLSNCSVVFSDDMKTKTGFVVSMTSLNWKKDPWRVMGQARSGNMHLVVSTEMTKDESICSFGKVGAEVTVKKKQDGMFRAKVNDMVARVTVPSALEVLRAVLSVNELCRHSMELLSSSASLHINRNYSFFCALHNSSLNVEFQPKKWILFNTGLFRADMTNYSLTAKKVNIQLCGYDIAHLRRVVVKRLLASSFQSVYDDVFPTEFSFSSLHESSCPWEEKVVSEWGKSGMYEVYFVSGDEWSIEFPHLLPVNDLYEELMATVEALEGYTRERKLVFGMGNSPVKNRRTPLVSFSVNDVEVKVMDDPLEASLGIHHQLWSAHSMREAERELLLKNRLKQMSTSKGNEEVLLRTLREKNSKDYCQQVRYYKENKSGFGCLWYGKAGNVHVMLGKPDEFRSDENILNFVIELGSECSNISDCSFVMPLRVDILVSQFTSSLREYGQEFISFDRMSVRGDIVGLQLKGSECSSTKEVVELTISPTQRTSFTIDHSVMPVKFFTDLDIDFSTCTVSYGGCYSSALNHFSLAIDKLISRTFQPRSVLNWWDSLRFAYHCNLSIRTSDYFEILLLMSCDPFNVEEYIVMKFRELDLRVAQGEFCLSTEQTRMYAVPSTAHHESVVIPSLDLTCELKWTTPHGTNTSHSICDFTLPPQFLSPRRRDDAAVFCSETFDPFHEFRAEELRCNVCVTLHSHPSPNISHSVPFFFLEPSSMSVFRRIGTAMYSYPPLRGPFLSDIFSSFHVEVLGEDVNVLWKGSVLSCEYVRICADDMKLSCVVRKDVRDENDYRWRVHGLQCSLAPFDGYVHILSRSSELFRKSPNGYPTSLPVEDDHFVWCDSVKFVQRDSFCVRVEKVGEVSMGNDVVPSHTDGSVSSPFTEDRRALCMNELPHTVMIHNMRLLWSKKTRDTVLMLMDQYYRFTRQNEIEKIKKLKVEKGKLQKHKGIHKSVETKDDEEEKSIEGDEHIEGSESELLKFYLSPEFRGERTVDESESESIPPRLDYTIQVFGVQGQLESSESDGSIILTASDSTVEMLDYSNTGKSPYEHWEKRELVVNVKHTEGYAIPRSSVRSWLPFDDGLFSSVEYPRILEIEPWSYTYEYFEHVASADEKKYEEPQCSYYARFPYVHAWTVGADASLLQIITNKVFLSRVPREKMLSDQADTLFFMSKLGEGAMLKRQASNDLNGLKRQLEGLRMKIREHELQLAGIREIPKVAVKKQKIRTLEQQFEKTRDQLKAWARKQKLEDKRDQDKVDMKTDIRVDRLRWNMLGKDRSSFLQWYIQLFTMEYSSCENESGSQTYGAQYIKVDSTVPDSYFPHVFHPHLEGASRFSKRDRMLRLYTKWNAPAAGICVYDHYELDMFPLRLCLTHDLYLELWYFFFPTVDEKDSVAKMEVEKAPEGSVEVTPSTHRRRVKREMSVVELVDEMKARAQKNMTFGYFKIQEVRLLVSFKGEREKGIMNLDGVPLVLHAVEYHGVTGSWADMAIVIKRDILGDVIPQAVKKVTKSTLLRLLSRGRKSMNREKGTTEPPMLEDEGDVDEEKVVDVVSEARKEDRKEFSKSKRAEKRKEEEKRKKILGNVESKKGAEKKGRALLGSRFAISKTEKARIQGETLSEEQRTARIESLSPFKEGEDVSRRGFGDEPSSPGISELMEELGEKGARMDMEEDDL